MEGHSVGGKNSNRVLNASDDDDIADVYASKSHILR